MKTEYRRDLQHSYLVLSPETGNEDAYPLRMITENKIQGLLSCSCRRMNEEILYYYDITSKISLAERCLCRKVTGDELLVLVQSMVRVLLDMDEYLLNGNSLCLKPQYIYMDVQMKTVDFCYVPGESWDLGKSFRELLEGILPLLDHQNQEGVLAGYGLYHYAVQESFSVEGLQRQLEQYRRNRGRAENQGISGHEAEIREIMEWECDTRGKKYEEEDKCNVESRESIIDKEQQQIEKRKHEAALDAFFEDDQEEKHSHPATVTLGTVGIVFYGLAGWYLWRNMPAFLWIWGGGSAVIIAAAVFIVRRRKKDHGKAMETEEGAELNKRLMCEQKRSRELEEKNEVMKKEVQFSEIGGQMEKYPMRLGEEECSTQILQTGFGKKTYILEEKYPNAGHQVCMSENDIQFIGHLKEMADVILPSNAVSRLHARFRRDEAGCYLRDLNSRNGTWVNGVELQGEQEVEVRPGDEIRFADMIYTLRQI